MMFKVICLFLLATQVALGSDVLEGTELEFVLLIHRHGDRTPVASSLPFTTEPEKVAELSAPFGYGQLTNVGKARSYELGKFLRSRYNDFLLPAYNLTEVFIRSTDSTRTKMTILAALAAIYPPEKGSWSQELKWTPVPYTTVPAKYDFNQFTANCPVFTASYYAEMVSDAPSMEKYSAVVEKISEVLGYDMTKRPVLVYAAYDAFVSQVRVLLNQFFTYAAKVQAGEDTQRIRIYSAHDVNVYSLEAACRVSYTLGVPKYNSMLALEMRKVTATGQYVVVPVYLPAPGEDLVYLPVEGCGVPCDFDTFAQITSAFVLDEDTWRDECGFTNDLVIDESNFA